jgi:RNA polymerase sigma factor (sigma-70 family)
MSIVQAISRPGVRRSKPSVAEDAKLIERVRAGDERAFEAIFKGHQVPLLSYARHMLANRDEAEDALQQAFIKAHRALLGDTVPRELRPWLYAIVRNCCLTAIAARRPTTELAERAENLTGLSEAVREREDLRELLADIRRLPEDQRSALLLAELDDLPHQSIAAIVGCPVNKVKALIYQARSTLIADRDARNAPCRGIREELAVARGGELRRGPLRRHLSLCAGCRDFQKALAGQHRSLAVVLPVLPSAGLAAKILSHSAIQAAGSVSQAGGAVGSAAAPAGAVAGGGASVSTAASTAASGAGAAAGGSGASAVVGSGVAAKVAVGGVVAALATAGAVTTAHHLAHPQHRQIAHARTHHAHRLHPVANNRSETPDAQAATTSVADTSTPATSATEPDTGTAGEPLLPGTLTQSASQTPLAPTLTSSLVSPPATPTTTATPEPGKQGGHPQGGPGIHSAASVQRRRRLQARRRRLERLRRRRQADRKRLLKRKLLAEQRRREREERQHKAQELKEAKERREQLREERQRKAQEFKEAKEARERRELEVQRRREAAASAPKTTATTTATTTTTVSTTTSAQETSPTRKGTGTTSTTTVTTTSTSAGN